MKALVFLLLCISVLNSQDLFSFQPIEEHTFQKISTKLVGQNLVLNGKIEKIGKHNYFTTYSYNNNLFSLQKYYVTNVVYNKPHPTWVKITGKYSQILGQRIEIEIQEYSNLQAEWQEASKNSQLFIEKNLKTYDLNGFKTTTRFKVAMSHLREKNLNLSPYIKINSPLVSHVDHDKGIIAIYCGKNMLHKSSIRGDFLSYYVVFNVNKEKIIRVSVVNTGYFLE
ncbi:hypothetical protein [Candidatus Uabimicrobium sp. HlEnr_7]|uniref:hypothetical protein n=1 Tax=Candidatus Uabimicrobium helgolandensis TaxID=3095367 RepID=UPI0035577221